MTELFKMNQFVSSFATLALIHAIFSEGTMKFCRRPDGLTRFDCSELSSSGIPTEDVLPSFVTNLSLAHNNISGTDNESISRFSNLTVLNLESNKLREIPESVARLEGTLENFNLKSNQITEIKNNSLSRFVQLKELSIEDNLLNRLPNFAFSNQTKLTSLNLRLNYISVIEENAFFGLYNLIFLELDLNFIDEKIERFPIWNPLLNLQVLNLAFNNFINLDLSSFCVLTRLKKLLLSDNFHLGRVFSSNVSSCLVSLELLDLANSNIVKMEPGALGVFRKILKVDFKFNPTVPSICFNFSISQQIAFANVESLDILITTNEYPNDEPLEKRGLCNLPSLQSISIIYVTRRRPGTTIAPKVTLLSKCLKQVKSLRLQLTHFPCDPRNYNYSIQHKDIFQGLDEIQLLNLSGNTFSNFYYIYNLTTLTTLDMSRNTIGKLQGGALSGLENLQMLDLSYNQIDTIEAEFFTEILNLKILILSRNNLVELPPKLFKSLLFLSKLDLSRQRVRFQPGAFNDLVQLKVLNLSGSYYPRLIDVNSYTDLNNLESLDLSVSGVFSIENPDFFKGLENLQNLYLGSNPIHEIYHNPFKYFKKLGRLNLDIISPVDDILTEEMIESIAILNIRNSSISAPVIYNKNNSVLANLNYSFNQISSFELKGNYSNLTKLDFSFNALTTFTIGTSLLELQEIHIQNNSRLSSNKILFSFQLPKVWYLNIGYSNLEILDTVSSISDVFVTLVNIRVLILDGNTVKKSFEKKDRIFIIFQNLSSLQNLSAAFCKIPLLKPDFFLKLNNLTSLDLSHNLISAVDPDLFRHLENMERLYLQGNPIQRINADSFKNLGKLRLMYAGDGLICCCRNFRDMKNFQEWLVNNIKNIQLADGGNVYTSYSCSSPDSDSIFMNRTIFQINFSKSCIFNWRLFQMYTIAIAVSLCCLILSITASVKNYWLLRFRYYMYRMKTRNYRPLVDREDIVEIEYNYDAFVCYGTFPNTEDSLWILNHVSPNLEGEEPKLRLCLHERDFLPGKAITENISEAIKTSRKVIFIVSNNFVKSKYCMFEVQMTLQILLSTHEDKMLFVIRENIPDEDMPPLLKMLINTRTYIEWPREEREQAEFWRRLRLALGPGEHLLPDINEEVVIN